MAAKPSPSVASSKKSQLYRAYTNKEKSFKKSSIVASELNSKTEYHEAEAAIEV